MRRALFVNNTANRKILILDDEPGVLDAYRIILEPGPSAAPIVSSRRNANAQAGLQKAQAETFDVHYYKSGPEAIAAIEKALVEKAPFAGGFFDVKLGGTMDGIEVIRQIKDRDPELLCVMVTAYQDRSVDEIANIFGAEFADRWDFLSKPFTRNEILQKSRNLVANWNRKQREKEYLKEIQVQQKQLIQSESLAAIGNLARGIGHEFGNILMGIVGKAELAVQKKTPEAMTDALKIIAASAQRAGVITRNLQTLVKTDSVREICELQGPVRECFALIEHEMKKANVKLVERHSPGLPLLFVNRVEISQVVLNLAINAIHAMREMGGGTLTISTSAHEGGVILEVADTGCGIPEENLGKIFSPFFTTKGKNGSGIGLSVTQKIVRNHGGKITVQSEVGKGSVFRVWLPKGEPQANVSDKAA